MSANLTAWLLTVALHGGVLVALAWVVDRALRGNGGQHAGAWRESLWRAALCGGALTATLQVASGLPSLAGQWQLVPSQLSAIATVAAPSASYLPLNEPSALVTTNKSTEPGETPAATGSLPVSAQPENVAKMRAAIGAAFRSSAWTTWIVCGWIAGALIALARVLRNWLALRRALALAVPMDESSTSDDASALAQQSGYASPRILSLDGLASPLATSRARIVLPTWALSTLDRAQLRAMLAHEVAHLSRSDPQWKLFVAVWLAVFWFVPFARIAQRRLDELAELACDAFSARAVGDGRDLAECLAACAERHQREPVREPTFALAAAMAVRESSFLQRIERLLEGIPAMQVENKRQTSAIRALTLCALLAGAVFLPGVGLSPRPAYAAQDKQAPAKHASQTDSSISIHSSDGSETTTISFSDGEHKFRTAIDGKVAFNAEENDVATLSAGGKATFEDTRGGVTQRIDVSEKGGQLVRRYFVNDTEHAWDDSARTWLAKLVVEVERSGVGAEAREQRLFAAGGAKRVLDEIEQIPNDYARSLYLKLLVAHGKLVPAELDRAVKIAGAAQSDYERRQQMQAIFQTQVLEAAQQITFLHQALRFDSDYERAELLVEIAPSLVDRADVRQAWLDAALGVHSDYERRRTLTSMLDRPGLDDAQLGSVIKASASMGSDYERRELLMATISRAHDVETLAPMYANSVQGIGSDYERREALLALIRSGKLGPAGAKAVLDTIASISSSYERREVLVELARAMPHDAALLERYRQVAGQLENYDRTQAEGALQL